MADSTQIRTKLNVFLQYQAATTVKNTLWNRMPLFDMLWKLNGHKKGAEGLGRPTGDILSIGRINGIGAPRKAMLKAARIYLPNVQISKPSTADVKAMSDYDSKPVVDNWDTTNATMKRFVQPRFKYARFSMPYKVAHSEVRTAQDSATTEGQAAAAVGSVYDAEVTSRTASLCEKLNADLFKTAAAGVPTDEDVVTWDKLHSILAALGTTNVYGGVDRSVSANSWWRGNTNTSTFSGSFEDMIEYCNYDNGLIAKGLSVGIILVGKELMKKAKAEARSAGYQLVSPAIPDPEFGFKTEMVVVNSGNRRVFITYDPQMDQLTTDQTTKVALCLDPTTWTCAVGPRYNWKVSEPSDQSKIEGGDEADTGTIDTELLLCCEVPSGNVAFTDVAV